MNQEDKNIKLYFEALKLEKEGNWDEAHAIVQRIETSDAAWIHAYLHRKEGDNWNADYWYKQAGKEFFVGIFEEEWNSLWDYFMKKK